MHRVLLALTLILVGCVSPSLPFTPNDFAHARRLFQLVDGGSREAEFRYTLADSELVIQHRHPRERRGVSSLVLVRSDRVLLDASTARSLWDKVEELGVARWKARYHPDDLNGQAFDGTRWSTYLRVEGVEHESWGFNVYPALLPLGEARWDIDERGVIVPTAYSELLAFFRRFDKQANKAPEPTPTSVTPRADARVAPAAVVAHL